MSDPTVSPDTASFRARVLELVERIPVGRVMTYGQLAVLVGVPGAARQVGFVMNGAGESGVPWQRVINAQGRISTERLGFGDIQRKLLEAEGIAFDQSGRCDLKRLQWWPDEEEQGGQQETQAGLF